MSKVCGWPSAKEPVCTCGDSDKLQRISKLVGREPTTSLANRILAIIKEPSREATGDDLA